MKIQPLSEETLEEALVLLIKVFNPSQDGEDYPGIWFPASLHPERHKELFKKLGVKQLQYYVAVEKGKVIGTTGYYTLKEDEKEAYWLAWFCVDKEYRGRGVGTSLLEFIIEKARKEKKRYLRLYTSDNPDEADAQKLYDKFGFKTTKTESVKHNRYKRQYKELII
ncbi:MAG TPA: GNAT family N-acetyltransferase [Candidatus Nanoarchaeia archaeon]|nr:GNAT family N-acetyltransferase [Candidatus Nanoarchaeia archaeon]